jgi:hypothetical protein
MFYQHCKTNIYLESPIEAYTVYSNLLPCTSCVVIKIILHVTHLLSNVPLKHALFCDRGTAEFTVTYRTIIKMPYFLVTIQTYNASPYVSPNDFSGIKRWAGDKVHIFKNERC